MGHLNILFISLTLLLILPAAFSAEAEDYQKAGLEQHNIYRKDHHADALTLNENMNEVAVKCAEYYAGKNDIDHTCPHKDKTTQGENLASAMGGEDDAIAQTKDAIRRWYDEVEYYDWDKPSNYMGKGGKLVGHFTQLVWKASKELGVGYFKKDNSFYVVALYSPPGNYGNQVKENVLPKNGQSGGGGSGVAPNQAPQWILVFLAATFIAMTWKELYN